MAQNDKGFNKEDAKLLKAWQMFQFSGKLSQEEYHTMLSSYNKTYTDIVDEQDENKGLNNYAEQCIKLTQGFKNDSRNWKSSLSFETIHKLGIATKSKDRQPERNRKVTELLKRPGSNEAMCNSTDPSTSLVNQCNERKLYRTSPCPTETVTNNSSSPSKSRVHNANQHDDRTLYRTQGKTHQSVGSGRNVSSIKTSPGKHIPVLVDNQATVLQNEVKEDVQQEEFITARQQFVMDQRKRKGNVPLNYGEVKKKSLGYRKGPSSRFTPPVRRNNDQSEKIEYGHRNTLCVENTDCDVTDERLKGVEPRMIELINNEIMDHGEPVEWHDIAGLEFAKNVIKEIVVWPMLRPDIFTGLRGPPKGLLLFGPPGTGKTLIGKCIASQSKATFFSISASSLTSKWIGEGEKMVRALFAVARCHQPAVIFIDEIDSLLSQRCDGEHESSRRIKTEFLIQLDGATTSGDDRLLVVGATNRPQEIDEAARRRMAKRLYIPLPEGKARGQIITNLLRDQSYSLSQDDMRKLVERSEGYSGSDMSNLCREASLGPIRSISANIQAITPDQVRPIVFSDFGDAFKQVRASVSSHDLDLYVQWNKEFGSGH